MITHDGRSKMANNITYQRMGDAMRELAKNMTSQKNTSLIRTLMGQSSPLFDESLKLNDIEFYDSTLNDSQKEAVRFALSASDVGVVHGPPGTGKTFTCVEIIRQLVKRGDRVLVCGPSNLSVGIIFAVFKKVIGLTLI